MMWDNPAGSDWDTASNWVNSANPSDQHVPTASDDAVIDLPDITVTHDSGTDSVNSIASQDPIVVNGGTLTIDSASTINSSLTVFINSQTNSGATLGVNGALAVNGLFTLGASSTLTGSGTVDAYGGLELGAGGSPIYTVSIQGTTLNNHGAATTDVNGEQLSLTDGAVINNLAGATFTAVGISGVTVYGDGSFHNTGTFIASTAVGGDVNIGPTFFNTGTVDVLGGELQLGGDGLTPNTGTITAAAGTSVTLSDEVLAPASVISSDGTVALDGCTEAGSYSAAGGTFATNSAFSGPVLDLGSSLEVSDYSGGSVNFAPAVGGPVTLTTGTLTIDPDATLTGTDSFVVDGLLTLGTSNGLTDTTLSVTGTVDAYGGIDLGSGFVVIRGTTLNNHAAATWDPLEGQDDLLEAGAVINNLVGASFTVTGSVGGGSIQAGDSSAAAFHNAGTLTCDAAVGSSASISVPFINTGSVVLQQGSLGLGGDGVTPSTGSFSAAAGTYLTLGNMVLAPGSAICSDGSVVLAGVTEEGNYSAGTTVTYGATFTGPVLGLGSSLVVAQYECSFAPAVGGPVTLTTGTLTIDPNSTLTGTDSFVVNGLLTLGPGSQLGVSGTVNAYGGLALTDGPVTIQATTLNNYGTATWDLGPTASIQLDAEAIINNMADATFETIGDASGGNSIEAGDSSAVAFNNTGNFTSSALGRVYIYLPFVNTGSIDVQQGYLDVPDFTGSGTVTVASGASFNGSGSVQSPIIVSSGQTLTTTPGETVSSGLILAGGTLDATGQLTVEGTLSLENGSTLTGGGPVDAYGGLSIAGDVAISADTLNNHGSATWDLGTIYAPDNNITLSNGAVINNLAGATFTTASALPWGGAIIAGDSSAVAFNNAGTFVCAGPTGEGGTNIGVPFTQTSSGATAVQAGGLSFTGEITIAGSMTVAAGTGLAIVGGGTVSGSICGAAGSIIQFNGPSTTLDTLSSLTCSGTVYIGGPVIVAGTYDVSGSTQVDSGILTFTAPIADLGADLDVDRGSVDITTAQSLSFTSVEIYDGTLSGAGSGDVTVTGSMSWDLGTISGLGTLTIASGATLDLGGLQLSLETLDDTTLDNAGTATLTTVYYPDGIALKDGAGIDNGPGGSFTFLDAYEGAYIFSDSSPTFFTNEGSLILAGETDIQAATFTETATGSTALASSSLEIDGSASICGSVTAALGTTIIFEGPSTSFGASSSLTSAGIVLMENTITVAGAYDVTGTTYAYSTPSNGVTFTAPIADLGTDLILDRALLEITTNQSFSFTDLDVYGSTLSGGGGNLTVTGSMTWDNHGTISGFGTLTIASQASLAMGDTAVAYPETLIGVALNNAGETTLSSPVNGGLPYVGLVLESNAVFNNEPGASFTFLTGALITSDGSATAFINQGNVIQAAVASGQSSFMQPAFTQTSTGTTVVTDSELNLVGGGSPVTNAGNVTIESGGTLSVSTNYDQTAGTTTLHYGTFSAGNLNIEGGALAGTGVVNANVTNAGQVIPGGAGAVGLLAINGTYTQTASGSLDVDLGGTTAGSQYDQLAVSGTASLGGTLDVGHDQRLPARSRQHVPAPDLCFVIWNFGFYNGIVLGNRLFLDPALNPTNLTLTVQPAVTTTTLATPASPSVSGQSVTFTATVTVALPPTTIDPSPTGTVTFYNNGQSIGTGTLSVVTGQDQASLTTATLSTASHPITAAYTSGDANFVPSPVSAAVTQVVNKDNTTTTVSASPSLANVGQTVTFTATVTANAPGSGTPTGTVDFYRHHDQHRPDARRRRALLGHRHVLHDEPGGRQPHDQGYLFRGQQLPHQQRQHRHDHDRPVDHRARPVGRRGAQPLGKCEHQAHRRRLRRLQLVDCPVGQRQRPDQSVGDRRARRRPEERQRELQPRADHGGRGAVRSARLAGGAEHVRPDQLRLREPERELVRDDQAGHLQPDHRLGQRQAHPEQRHLHHRRRRVSRSPAMPASPARG